MNRFLFCALPTLSQASEFEGVHLLQKHTAKAAVSAVPVENVPPMAGYRQQEGVSYGVGRCQISNSIGATSFEDCKRTCDGASDCGGWTTSVFDLGGMPGPGGMMMPVNHNCYYFCTTSPQKSDARMYSYIKEATTVPTTTSSTTKYVYTTDPGIGNCDPSGGWNEKKLSWCCANRADFPDKEKFCPDAVVAGAVDDPHISSMDGGHFDVYTPGEHEFLVVPAGATPETADLHISGKVRKFGDRQNDLWIRKLNIQGRWVQDGPYQFKTTSLPFGKKKSTLFRNKASTSWKALAKAAPENYLQLVSDVDTSAPTQDFGQSVSKKVELKAGPATVLVDFATSQIKGQQINHLDLHLKGLTKAENTMSGLLAGDMAALQIDKRRRRR